MKLFFPTSIQPALVACAFAFACEGVFADAEADLFVGYDASYASSVGGQDNVEVNAANAIAGSNAINARSGTPARLRIVGFKQSNQYNYERTSNGGFVGWMANNDSRISDIVAAGNNLNADLITFVCTSNDDGAGAVAQQPGRYSSFDGGSFWSNVVAHEVGGHNYDCDHRGGSENPKTIMLHNYCGGGSQGYFSNPNIWLNGAKLIGDGSCLGAAVDGGDNAYRISLTAQGVADREESIVYGSYLGAVRHRWKFNTPAAPAPAGTVVTDAIAGAPAVVRGQDAVFTGNGLRLPGGTTGNVGADSIAAYLDLPNGIFKAMPNFSIEIWATPVSGADWMRVLEIGRTVEPGDGLGAAGEYTGTPGTPAPGLTSGSDVIGLSASTVGNSLNNQRLVVGLNGTTQTSDSNWNTQAGTMQYYVVTFKDTSSGGTVTWYRNGKFVRSLDVAFNSADLEDVNNWLGRSLWSGDQMSNIEYHDVRIQGGALRAEHVAGNYLIGPNDAKSTQWASDPFGSSGFIDGNWEFGRTPVATRDYETVECRLRTPANGANNTFPGKSLTITGGTLLLKGTAANTTTINDLRLSGGTIAHAGGNVVQALAGNLSVLNASINHIRGANGTLDLKSTITGFGTMLYSEDPVKLWADNTGFTGQTVVGDGRFSTLIISKEENLGGNPPWWGGAWLELNRGILNTTATMTIGDANRGVRIGRSGGIIRPNSGTTLTIATPISSPASGDTLQTVPLFPNPVVGLLFKEGGGTLVLTHPNNSYIGEMQINQGELRLDDAGRLNNGDMHMPLAINSTLNVNTTGNQIFGGVVSGGGTFIKGNTGTTTFYAANTFSGNITINGGTVYTRAANADNNRNFSFVSGITVNNGGTLRTQANSLFGWNGTQEKPITVNAGGTLTVDGGADSGVGTITLAGGTLANLGASVDWGSWRFDQATDVLKVTADSTVSATNVKFGNAEADINVSPGRNLNFTGTITNANAGGTSYLTKTGTGTLTLAGANTYTGATALNEGTLNLTGSLGATAVSVASGATLKGTGAVGGSVGFATNAVHSPGTGSQAIAGTASYENGSRLKWTLSSNSNAAGVASRATVSGTVTVAAGAAIDLILNDAGSTVNYFDAFWTQARTWTVVSSGGGMNGQFTLGNVGNDAQGKAASGYGSFSLSQNGTGATLQWTPKAFAAWRGANFGVNAGNSAVSDFTADPDKDGLANAWEYFHATSPGTNSAAPFQVKIENNRAKLTFPRNLSATDALVKIQAAVSPAGPWTDLAQSTGGAAFSASVGGVTVTESGSGATRSVEFNDLYQANDPAYPKRFFRLWIQQQ